MMLMGEKTALLHDVQLIDIHGTRFYDLVYAHDDEQDQLRRARLGVEDVYAHPTPGQRVSISYLMGVATSVKQIEE